MKFCCTLNYHNHALRSRGSYGYSALFLQRSQYISLDFYVLKKTENANSGRVALKCAATVLIRQFIRGYPFPLLPYLFLQLQLKLYH